MTCHDIKISLHRSLYKSMLNPHLHIFGCNFIFLRTDLYDFLVSTLRLHYNAVLYNADSIITPSPRGFYGTICVKMSADDCGIHNASCENRTPCVF